MSISIIVYHIYASIRNIFCMIYLVTLFLYYNWPVKASLFLFLLIETVIQ